VLRPRPSEVPKSWCVSCHAPTPREELLRGPVPWEDVGSLHRLSAANRPTADVRMGFVSRSRGTRGAVQGVGARRDRLNMFPRVWSHDARS
jgi:hypothetical protein